MRLKCAVNESTRAPLALSHFSNRESKEEAASPQKRKPTPPRCARQPLPREGASVDTPSFLWKEVSRRGGGWMGERDKKERGRSSQVRRLREHPIHRCAVPLPQWGRLTIREYRFSYIVKANIRICEEKQYRRTKPSPRGEGGERSEPDRVLAV